MIVAASVGILLAASDLLLVGCAHLTWLYGGGLILQCPFEDPDKIA
jgi:hypothetical protein